MVAARLALCLAELPILYAEPAEVPRCRAAYEKRLRQLLDDVEDQAVGDDFVETIGLRQPFYLAYQAENDRELQSIYGSMVCRTMAKHYSSDPLPASTFCGKPLRVGFVSGYFKSHTIWKLALWGWLSQLDRRRFTVTGYYTGSTNDSATKIAAGTCDRFVQGPMSTDAWRRTILADAPHALVYPEIGMDPMAVRLAAQRLAPVQCNFWGHPETSGFPTLDFFLSSGLMEPPDGDNHYTEKLVRLPNLSIYYEPPQVRPIAMKREQLGFRATATAYWCAQSLFKYLPHFDEIYPRIAREVGDCQFAFIQHQGAREVTDLFLKRLEAAFSAYGLRASDYCVTLPRLDAQQFISAIGCCDVILDSIGWSGGNTTLESLCHNLPIVTLPGGLMRSRHTAAILTMMGVTETIVPSIDHYVATAVKLAHNPVWRAAIQQRMATQKECVYRDIIAIRALEDFLENAIRAYPDRVGL